jgi:hypothetical protein
MNFTSLSTLDAYSLFFLRRHNFYKTKINVVGRAVLLTGLALLGKVLVAASKIGGAKLNPEQKISACHS